MKNAFIKVLKFIFQRFFTSEARAYSTGYKAIYIPNIVTHCTSKDQDNKCNKFPTRANIG